MTKTPYLQPPAPTETTLSPQNERLISGLLGSVALSAEVKRPLVTYKKEQDTEAGYKNSHPLIEEKIIPRNIQRLATELALPRNAKISEEAQKGKSFEECLGILAARLDIALDGAYDADKLAGVLLSALQNRKPGAIQGHHLRDPRLKNVELVETADSLTLEEVADQQKISGIREAPSGEGPYTICRSCITSFSCCQERNCKLGTPAQQLGNSVKTLETLRKMEK